MVVFSELESLVQMARYATEKLPQYRETNRTNKNPPDTVTPDESGDNIDSTPEADVDENTYTPRRLSHQWTQANTTSPE